ncbi:raffinose/stachyose/melibiose transport system permease protein [Anoxybacillus tepidamans]|uniref:Raffinose/stachyose/melibiose transport system permease protein n=1 Tax=Anoxybacteroides tepidamans TaxID=265948 RepID=A0A7W8IML1_9BACL|nr:MULTISPECIES: carbohydrate ABC transporter permease [Bacillaceae]MBB5323260.1 raffinose/stachyose/melibiose transport system permease protein [Anoxybacillus tepidamans]PJW13137.1 sugar ABC transporter permease [Geobacillus sp. Manikaran-105]
MNVSKALTKMVRYIVLVIFFCLYILPFILVLLNSLKERTEIISNPLSIPKSINFANYLSAMEKMNFANSFMNSLIITVFSVALITIFSAMTAYVFVRIQSKLNKFLFFLMVASMIIPFQAIMIPLVQIYGSIGFLNSKWALIYMYIGFGASLAVFIYHGLIKSIPLELEEAAMIDGASRLQIFFQVVFPLLKPTTMTIVILNVLWIWNDFLLPSLVLIKPEERTLPLSTFYFFGTYSVDYGLLMAGLVVTIIPVIIVYLFTQRYIIQGVMNGSIK